MKINLLAVGTRMPKWVCEGVEEYARRISRPWQFTLVEAPLAKRSKNQRPEDCMEKEGKALLERLQPSDYVVALDVKGRSLSTEQLSAELDNLSMQGRDLNLLVGGPDGLSPACLQRADARWSLSALTLPHPLVRVVVVEQLYRACCYLAGHPYHRE